MSVACCPWFALQVAVCVSGFLLYSAVFRPAVVAMHREGAAVVLWLCAFMFAGFCSVVWWVSAAVVVALAHTTPADPACVMCSQKVSHTLVKGCSCAYP
jgi:type IV secretory pathway TrbD component